MSNIEAGAYLSGAELDGVELVARQFLDPETVRLCASSLSEEWLNGVQQSMLDDGAIGAFNAETNQFDYPSTKRELDEIAQNSRGVIMLSLDHYVPVVAGVRRALKKTFWGCGEIFGRPDLTVNAYCSPANESVLPLHKDLEPVVAMQIEGKKEVILGSSEADGNTQSAVTTLNPGDALYIPTGVFHSFQSVEGYGKHLCATLHLPKQMIYA